MKYKDIEQTGTHKATQELISPTVSDNSGRVGVVLVTHSDYGARLLEAAILILGNHARTNSVSVNASLEVAETLMTLKQVVASCDAGTGVLILTDMFGGTPTNLSLSLLGNSSLEVLTGVNLPMLLKVLGSRHLPLPKLAQEAKNAGCQGIVVVRELLRTRLKGE